jgi:hypothetical protein
MTLSLRSAGISGNFSFTLTRVISGRNPFQERTNQVDYLRNELNANGIILLRPREYNASYTAMSFDKFLPSKNWGGLLLSFYTFLTPSFFLVSSFQTSSVVSADSTNIEHLTSS